MGPLSYLSHNLLKQGSSLDKLFSDEPVRILNCLGSYSILQMVCQDKQVNAFIFYEPTGSLFE